MLLIALCMGVISCSGDKSNESADVTKAIGSYTFDGAERDIVSGVYAEADGYIDFMFSPCASLTDNRHTTIMLSIKEAFEGEQVDVTRLYHNDDYIFSYEDNLFYYSRYNALQSGSIRVKRLANGGFLVEMTDIRLADGRDFSLSFDGVLSSVADITE